MRVCRISETAANLGLGVGTSWKKPVSKHALLALVISLHVCGHG
jgi:hypothetical protein